MFDYYVAQLTQITDTIVASGSMYAESEVGIFVLASFAVGIGLGFALGFGFWLWIQLWHFVGCLIGKWLKGSSQSSSDPE